MARIFDNIDQDLLTALRATMQVSTRTGDTIAYAAFNYQALRPILEEIDQVVAGHFGFTEAQADFIVSYDAKYRMGQSGEDDDD